MNATNTTNSTPPLTIDALLEAINKLPKEPFAELMRSEGYPPETHVMLLPVGLKEADTIYPYYVGFHRLNEEDVYFMPCHWLKLRSYDAEQRA